MSDRPTGDPPPTDGTAPLLRRLVRLRLRARAALLFERAWPEAWPPLGVLGAFLCVALLDLPRMLPAALHILLLAGFAVAFVWTTVRALRAVRLPSEAEADRRLERATGLRHRPLSVLTDRPALPGAEGLWRAHVIRAVAQVGRLHVGLPRPGLAARDPRALRGGLLVALAATLVIAGDDAGVRLARAVVPALTPAVPPAPTEVQGWITPPAYTNLAPVFLHPDGGAVAVPAGSHLTVSLSGGSGTPSLTLAGKPLPFAAIDGGGFQADADLAGGGRLSVRRGGENLAGWDLTVVADTAPIAQWPEPPGAARNGGRIPPTRLPWQVSHAYGVVSLQAELHLKDRPEAPALVVPIPLPGGALKSGKGARIQDLTASPWAGLPVVGKLVARDAPGLTGMSGEAGFTLPARRFDNPVARRLIAVRSGLTLRPDERGPALADLAQIAGLDEVWHDDAGGYLNLSAIVAELSRDRGANLVEDAQSRLWLLALHLEEGGSERTARALAEARRELREAIEAQKRGEKIDPAEIDRRIAALEQAIEKHLEALAEQLRQDPDARMADPEEQKLNAQDAQKLAEELRDLEKQGKPEAAEQKLAELEKMLDELQRAKPQHRDAKARERQAKRQKGQQQMNALQDLVRREGGLLDRAQARGGIAPPAAATGGPPHLDTPPGAVSGAPDERQTSESGAGVPEPARDAERATDRRVQQALRRALGELMQQYGDLMGKIPPNLGDADSAMRDGIQALGDGLDSASAGADQRAIEALQKGGQSMSEQMESQFGAPGDDSAENEGEEQTGPGLALGDEPGRQQQDQGGGNRPWTGKGGPGKRGDRRTDPFGRPLNEGNNGGDESTDVSLPEQMEEARTRAIQDELRRRGADRSRPQPELDYIDRLLKQF
jgi:uncharacterized protein (TIGR02302 family)